MGGKEIGRVVSMALTSHVKRSRCLLICLKDKQERETRDWLPAKCSKEREGLEKRKKRM